MNPLEFYQLYYRPDGNQNRSFYVLPSLVIFISVWNMLEFCYVFKKYFNHEAITDPYHRICLEHLNYELAFLWVLFGTHLSVIRVIIFMTFQHMSGYLDVIVDIVRTAKHISGNDLLRLSLDPFMSPGVRRMFVDKIGRTCRIVQSAIILMCTLTFSLFNFLLINESYFQMFQSMSDSSSRFQP